MPTLLLFRNNAEAVMEGAKKIKSVYRNRHGFQVNYLAAVLMLDKLLAESGLVVTSLAGRLELAQYDAVQSPVEVQNRLTGIHGNVGLTCAFFQFLLVIRLTKKLRKVKTHSLAWILSVTDSHFILWHKIKSFYLSWEMKLNGTIEVFLDGKYHS